MVTVLFQVRGEKCCFKHLSIIDVLFKNVNIKAMTNNYILILHIGTTEITFRRGCL